MRQPTQTTQTVIVGTRPVGSCPADGTHRWAVRYHEDGLDHFIVFDGWLQESEHRTDDPAMADTIEQALKDWLI